jgi:hypothetical protein
LGSAIAWRSRAEVPDSRSREMLADELYLSLEGARVTAQGVGREDLGARLTRMSEAMIAAHKTPVAHDFVYRVFRLRRLFRRWSEGLKKAASAHHSLLANGPFTVAPIKLSSIEPISHATAARASGFCLLLDPGDKP